MRIFYISICLFFSAQAYAQVNDTTWNGGKIQTVRNRLTDDELEFTYDKAGKLTSTTLFTTKNGIQYNHKTEYYPEGGVKSAYFYYVIHKVFFGINKMDSIATDYDVQGRMTYQYFFGNEGQVIRSVKYYPNNQIENDAYYLGKKLHNVHFYDQQGHLLSSGTFKDGNGDLINYEAGMQVNICTYRNGKVIRRTCHCN